MPFFSQHAYGRCRGESMSLGELKNQFNRGSITIPSFQRKFVWVPALQQRYLETVGKRGPLYGFIMNRKEDETYDLIDGQNRCKTLLGFMSDEITYVTDEGDEIKFSEMEQREQRIFESIRVNYILADEWNNDDCQEYFQMIQEGMKLTKGEMIHSAQNNIFQNKIVHLANLFQEILQKKKKEGGFHYTNKRYIHYEIIGGLLKIFMDNKYYDRPGQVALKEMKKWTDFGSNGDLSQEEIERLANLDAAVVTFEKVMMHYVILREASDNLSNMTYSRDATFIRSMFFIFKNDLHLVDTENGPSQEVIQRFDEMMGVILTKNTPLYDYITLCGTKGKMNQIMGEYKRVYDNPLSQFINPENYEEVSDVEESDETDESNSSGE